MKLLLLLLTTALLSIGVLACGNASKGTVSTRDSSSGAATNGTSTPTASSATSTQNYAKADSDKDNDTGGPTDDTNNETTLNYGHPVSAANKQAIAVVIKRYYTAATADNGAKACTMLVSSLAKAVPEDYGHGSVGPPYLSSGKTCSAVMALLFKHSHSQLAAELPKLEVTRVHLVGNHGFAILTFGTMPERQILVGREGHMWKVQSLLDSELP